MALFGKKQKAGEQPAKNNKKKKRTKVDNKPKFKTPRDVKLSYVMPVIMTLSFAGLGTATVIYNQNNTAYNNQVLASSMKVNTELPSWGRPTQAKLSVGASKLSPDGKDLAVQIKYDTNAHTALTSFGDQYRLRLITEKNNQMPDAKLSYGMFGTDGSGILTIHNDKGFNDRAFVVMIIDGSQLVTADDVKGDNTANSSDTSGTSTVSDSDLDNSITAQLSDTNSPDGSKQSNDSSKAKALAMPPIYYIRLNAHNATKAKHNWTNDRDLVDELFINQKIASIKSNIADSESQIKILQKTTDEMNRRLKANPSDSIAKDNLNTISQKMQGMQSDLSNSQDSLKTLQNSVIKQNVLEPKQTKHDTIVTDISSLK